MLSLAGKRAVVTGGGRGIGLGITRALREAGAEVFIAQRSPPPAEISDDAGIHFLETDLTRRDAFNDLARQIADRSARLDLLVNNAGIMFERGLDDMTADEWDRMLAVNLNAPVFLTQALLPLLRAAGQASIVNIGSIEGLAANPGHSAYCATKGAIHALTKALAVDLGADGIRVNAIAPGWIRSELSDNYIDAQADPEAAWQGLHAMHPAGRVGEPADVGKLAVYLASVESAFVTGQIMVVDGGRTSKLPLPF